METLKGPDRRGSPERPLQERIQQAYQMAVAQKQPVETLPREEINSFIGELLTEIDRFERAANSDPMLRSLTPELARSIGVIWTFSGPGTYCAPTKNDRYEHLSWAAGMDRSRLNYTARLARRITEESTGTVFKARQDTYEATVQKNKDAIRESGPHIVYNGLPIENEAVERVLAEEGTVVPAEKVTVIKDEIRNTIDQINTFRLPEHALDGGKKIGIVSHAPHLARIIRMIERYQPFPRGTEIILFPLPTPAAGKEEYATMEACGTLYYSHFSPNKDASKEPYRYTLYKPSHE